MEIPPSRRSICPHIWLDEGLTRKTTPCAISQGSAKRPRGVRSIMGSPLEGSLRERGEGGKGGRRRNGTEKVSGRSEQIRCVYYRLSAKRRRDGEDGVCLYIIYVYWCFTSKKTEKAGFRGDKDLPIRVNPSHAVPPPPFGDRAFDSAKHRHHNCSPCSGDGNVCDIDST